MGRNRKHGSAARFVPAVKAALICLLLGGSAIGYVYQKNQIIELGKQIQLREKNLKGLIADNLKWEKTRMTLESTTWLNDRVTKMNLGLAQPAQGQILTLVETPATAVPKSEPLYAGSPAAASN
jgi:hypothetical protein